MVHKPSRRLPSPSPCSLRGGGGRGGGREDTLLAALAPHFHPPSVALEDAPCRRRRQRVCTGSVPWLGCVPWPRRSSGGAVPEPCPPDAALCQRAGRRKGYLSLLFPPAHSWDPSLSTVQPVLGQFGVQEPGGCHQKPVPPSPACSPWDGGGSSLPRDLPGVFPAAPREGLGVPGVVVGGGSLPALPSRHSSLPGCRFPAH